VYSPGRATCPIHSVNILMVFFWNAVIFGYHILLFVNMLKQPGSCLLIYQGRRHGGAGWASAHTRKNQGGHFVFVNESIVVSNLCAWYSGTSMVCV